MNFRENKLEISRLKNKWKAKLNLNNGYDIKQVYISKVKNICDKKIDEFKFKVLY